MALFSCSRADAFARPHKGKLGAGGDYDEASGRGSRAPIAGLA